MPHLLLLLSLCLPTVQTPPTADDFAAVERDLSAQRRELRHKDLLARYEALGKSASEPSLKGKVASRVASLSLELHLLEKLGALDTLRARTPGELAAALRKVAQSADEELTLAQFCFFHGLGSEGESALARARDKNPELRAETDRLLAEARKEAIPPGGYHRYRGVWLSLVRRDQCALLDEALERLQALDLDGAHVPFRLDGETSSFDRFQDHFHDAGAGADFMRQAVKRIRAALQADYEEIRGWLPTYSTKAPLYAKLLQKHDEMEKPRREMLELIGRYQKPEQPSVDQYRATLEHLHEEYQALKAADRQRFDHVPAEEAHAMLQRVARREEAIASVHRYLEKCAPPGLEPAPIDAPATAPVTRRHVLPGREHSSLEDVLWLLLEQRAGQLNDVIERAADLLARRDLLTPWEALLAEDLQAEAIASFDDRAASSLDGEERRFLERLNQYRRVLGLRLLQIDERCNVASRKHSQEMVELNYFGHVSPVARNRTPSDRVRLEGFSGVVGENCLKGSCDGVGAFEGWYHSPGHHRNLVGGGPQLGVGAVRDHTMWTMVVGGADYAWRAVHRDLPPARRAELERAARALADAGKRPKKKPSPQAADASTTESAAVLEARTEQARAAAAAMLPDILPFVARQAFSAATSALSDERECFPMLLAFVAEAQVPSEWHPLRAAAVGALIDALEDSVPGEVRAKAFRYVPRFVDNTFGYQPDADKAARAASLTALRKYWQDEAEVFFGGKPGAVAAKEQPTPPAGHGAGDGASPAAPRKVLAAKDRLRLARQFGGSAETEKAVERALAWLARVQDEDGAWRARSFATLNPQLKASKENPGVGSAEWEIAMTGLSLIAFITAGNTTTQGTYAAHVRRGAQFLLEHIVDYGKFETTASHYMYNHAIATQALCELYSYTGDRQIGIGAQLAVDYLMYAQHTQSGGWRYNANEVADTSVTGWVILALNSAYKAGLEAAGFHGALRYLNSVTEPYYHRVGYQSPADEGIGRNRLGAVAMVGRLFLGVKKEDPRIVYTARRLKNNLPRRGEDDFYYWYYATLGMFQVGDEYWEAWNGALIPALLATQNNEATSPLSGSWPVTGEFGPTGGRIMQTAFGVLMLTTYYRYERALTPRLYAFSGDLQKEVEPYFATLRSDADPMQKAIAHRKMVDRFGSALPTALIELLKKPEEKPEFRDELAGLLFETAVPEHESAILKLLPFAGTDAIRETLLRTLDGICSVRSVPALIELLSHENATVRRYAADALGRIADPGAAGPLGERLAAETDDACNATIAAALRRLAHRESISLVLDDALAADAPGRLAVLGALDVLEREGVAKQLLATRPAEPALYQKCLAAIAKDKEAAAIPILLALLESKDLATRTSAVKLLRAITLRDLPFTPEASIEERKKQLTPWQQWWSERSEEFGVAGAKTKR